MITPSSFGMRALVLVSEFEDHGMKINRVAVSPDAAHITSYSDSHDLRIVKFWDTDSGVCIATFEILADDIVHYHTDHGTLLWDMKPQGLLTYIPDKPSNYSYWMSNDKHRWFMWNGYNVLWLPPEYWPYSADSASNAVVIGFESGLATSVLRGQVASRQVRTFIPYAITDGEY